MGSHKHGFPFLLGGALTLSFPNCPDITEIKSDRACLWSFINRFQTPELNILNYSAYHYIYLNINSYHLLSKIVQIVNSK